MDGPGIKLQLEQDFPKVQSGLFANPAHCSMGKASFKGVEKEEAEE